MPHDHGTLSTWLSACSGEADTELLYARETDPLAPATLTLNLVAGSSAGGQLIEVLQGDSWDFWYPNPGKEADLVLFTFYTDTQNYELRGGFLKTGEGLGGYTRCCR